ncbi:hypothetical protein TanjilG_07604 [Lupinus angustifolius]|uniref:REF/SRPP-like protein n=1 Tax=Lupinus angustifolius TaxID=3871 RepID=A0A1J7HYN8_LUPAN|nr:PREDICTED: REF/SRPP-like protein At1g67360 [Lupinus angustifolius]OIW18020.1 hypothetical protein TanjilG_07604 [Lupinus angustifolius]
MATTNETKVVERKKNDEQKLKHLGFVKIVVIQTLVCVSYLYQFAKKNSGPLRSAVGTVEDTVINVLGPVYDKIKGVPVHLLVFVDNKVDEATHKIDEQAPPLIKQVANQSKVLINKVSQKAEKLVNLVHSGGPKAAAKYVATESKQFVLTGSVKLWASLNHYPLFYVVAKMAIPTAAHWSEKYNHVVKGIAEKGYNISEYLPLIPIDEIAKAFKQGQAKVNGNENDATSSDSD